LKGTEQKSTNYEEALGVALETLAGVDISKRSRHCRGTLIREGEDVVGASFRFMGRSYIISQKEGDVTAADGSGVPIHYKILLLHCFLYHTGEEPTGEWISFVDIPDGLLYGDIYKARTAVPLSFSIAGEPTLLVEAVESMGGRGADLGGDVSAFIEPFFGIPVGIVFWRGEDEFPPSVNFLYDRTIIKIIPAEDVVVLTQALVGELRRYIKEKKT
jgi:hypothetical protein